MICAGIDAGSRATKVLLFDTEQARIVGSGLADQGVEQHRLASELFERICGDAQLDRATVEPYRGHWLRAQRGAVCGHYHY